MTTKLTYARETLEATPARAATLLFGIAKSNIIRAELGMVGLTSADLEEGLQLLRDCCALRRVASDPVDTAEVQSAITTLDAWDERALLIVRATLSHRFAAQARFLLSGLEAAQGPEAVSCISRLLARLDDLESDPRREETRLDDQAALAVLAARGLPPQERARLRGLVDLVNTATTGKTENPRTQEGETLAALTRLRVWYDEWADLCRAVLTRPSLLKRVGLAPSAKKIEE